MRWVGSVPDLRHWVFGWLGNRLLNVGGVLTDWGDACWIRAGLWNVPPVEPDADSFEVTSYLYNAPSVDTTIVRLLEEGEVRIPLVGRRE
mgnify:CR=1 FL=1